MIRRLRTCADLCPFLRLLTLLLESQHDTSKACFWRRISVIVSWLFPEVHEWGIDEKLRLSQGAVIAQYVNGIMDSNNLL